MIILNKLLSFVPVSHLLYWKCFKFSNFQSSTSQSIWMIFMRLWSNCLKVYALSVSFVYVEITVTNCNKTMQLNIDQKKALKEHVACIHRQMVFWTIMGRKGNFKTIYGFASWVRAKVTFLLSTIWEIYLDHTGANKHLSKFYLLWRVCHWFSKIKIKNMEGTEGK